MKYLFGDSTEFHLQKNFLETLNNFVNTSIESITNENNILLFKGDINNICKIRDDIQHNMDNFFSSTDKTISDIVSKNGEREDVVIFIEKSKDFLKRTTDIHKENFSDETSQNISQLEKKIHEIKENNIKILEEFLRMDPILTIGKEYTLIATKDGYSIKVKVGYESDILCVFDIPSSELPFWGEYIKVCDFIKGIEIPIGMKKAFLRKELKPEFSNIDDYFISDLRLSGSKLEVIFNKRFEESSERFRLKIDLDKELSPNIYYIGEDCTEKNINNEFKDELNVQKLYDLGKKIAEQINSLYSKERHLENICLHDIEIFDNDKVFEFITNVAKIYAPIIGDINKHSPLKEELSLKIEDDENQRKEIYLNKSQIKGTLSMIKDKGDKLFECLGLDK